MLPLARRRNKKNIETDHIPITQAPAPWDAARLAIMREAAERIRTARWDGRPVVLVFGAHTIKNGLAKILIRLMEKGWVTHLATNGAGIIHDWEFAFLGQSSEDVRANVQKGEFGNWQETGYYINLAINIGAWAGCGYGESVGKMIEEGGLLIPRADELESILRTRTEEAELCASAADLLGLIRLFNLPAGWMAIPHSWKSYSVQAAAYRHKIPFTGHPMIGHDIIYNHPMNHGGLLGRAALRDFLVFAETISRIETGVYISLGSAVMSPMIFEKAFSMAQNIALQTGAPISRHYVLVADLAPSPWDWSKGEPPEDNPAYYLRFLKSFNRMGGTMRYLSADNRDFLLYLLRHMEE